MWEVGGGGKGLRGVGGGERSRFGVIKERARGRRESF